MDREPLTIEWKDLTSPEVDAKLDQMKAVRTTLNHYEASDDVVAAASRGEAWYYNTAVFLTIFGLVGGILGWAIGGILHLRPDARSEARLVIADYEKVKQDVQLNDLRADIARQTLGAIKKDFASNPYFAIYVDEKLNNEQRVAAMRELEKRDEWNNFLANVLFFGFSGLMIAVFLAMAEPLVERNFNRATINGTLGAFLGMGGGVAVALIQPRIHQQILGMIGDNVTPAQLMFTNAVEWGILGIFIAAAPGVLLGNVKRLGVGVVGGLIGGLIGGALFQPIADATNEHMSRFVGIVAIGTIAGLASGLLENAVKTGWLKVTQGLIAGKQFVIYRNPTYIGAHPSCHIYLWKDAQVGKRHAAVHLVPGGIELENLPLGGSTLINGKPVTRARLKAGDKVQVGRTVFEFQEKQRAA